MLLLARAAPLGALARERWVLGPTQRRCLRVIRGVGGGCAGGGDVSRPLALGPGHDEGGRWRVPYATIDDASVWPPCRRLGDQGDRPPERDQLHELARAYAEAGTGIGRLAALADGSGAPLRRPRYQCGLSDLEDCVEHAHRSVRQSAGRRSHLRSTPWRRARPPASFRTTAPLRGKPEARVRRQQRPRHVLRGTGRKAAC
jgi:hypothetical protein